MTPSEGQMKVGNHFNQPSSVENPFLFFSFFCGFQTLHEMFFAKERKTAGISLQKSFP